MDILKQELLKSLTFEYLRFLGKSNKYNEVERKERITSLEKIKASLVNTLDVNELDNAIYWTVSNFLDTLQNLPVSSVPHMVSFTNSLLELDTDWQTRYQHFYK